MEILRLAHCGELLLIILAHFEVEVAPPRWPAAYDVAQVNELHWVQALGKSHSIIAVGTSLHSALVVDNELVVNPNLLPAGREIVNAILTNIDETSATAP